MKVNFKYGTEGLTFELSNSLNSKILKARSEEIISSVVEAIKNKINNPIGTLSLTKLISKISPLNKICIVISDATRPAPSKIMLTAIIEVLEENGVRDDQIRILIATGLHRKSRNDELERIIGRDFLKRFEFIDHKAENSDDLKFLGDTEEGSPIYINKYYLESNFKIITGYVEPHFFAGFSGGKKSIVPGIAGAETIKANHSAKNISSPYARFGVFKENPLHKNSIEISKKAGVDFCVNVCINDQHLITKIAAGDFEKVHEFLVNYQLKQVFQEIDEQYDIVICGNGGFPLDINLYQAVKSMALGELAVKEGGYIISVNEMSDGVGHEKFRELLFCGRTPKEIYNDIVSEKIKVADQWEIQILTRVLQKARIIVVSNLSEDQIGNIGLIYAKTIEDAIKTALNELGQNAKILVLPDGPLVLPKLSRGVK